MTFPEAATVPQNSAMSVMLFGRPAPVSCGVKIDSCNVRLRLPNEEMKQRTWRLLWRKFEGSRNVLMLIGPEWTPVIYMV
jgi:hypothetical protein